MTTLATFAIAKLTIADRQRQAEQGRLVAMARRVAACCTGASVPSRLPGFGRGVRHPSAQ